MPWLSRSDVVSKVLGHIGLDVKALHEGAVVDMQDLKQKLDGGVLLELEPLPDGTLLVSSIMPTAQRQVRLLRELQDGERRPAIVEQAKVFLSQASDEVAFLVGDSKD